MRIASLLAVAALLIAPSVASAECSWSRGHEVTMSCGEGSTWDEDSASCITTATS